MRVFAINLLDGLPSSDALGRETDRETVFLTITFNSPDTVPCSLVEAGDSILCGIPQAARGIHAVNCGGSYSANGR